MKEQYEHSEKPLPSSGSEVRWHVGRRRRGRNEKYLDISYIITIKRLEYQTAIILISPLTHCLSTKTQKSVWGKIIV